MKILHIPAALASLLIIVIAGCGEAPVRKPEGGERFSYETGATPYSAAICIARNARRSSGSIEAEEGLVGDSSMEVVVRSSGETLAVAQVHREGMKSRVSIEVIRAPGNDGRGFARMLMSNC